MAADSYFRASSSPLFLRRSTAWLRELGRSAGRTRSKNHILARRGDLPLQLLQRIPQALLVSWLKRPSERQLCFCAGSLFEDFLRRADLTGSEALPYEHVKFTWYERRTE